MGWSIVCQQSNAMKPVTNHMFATTRSVNKFHVLQLLIATRANHQNALLINVLSNNVLELLTVRDNMLVSTVFSINVLTQLLDDNHSNTLTTLKYYTFLPINTTPHQK